MRFRSGEAHDDDRLASLFAFGAGLIQAGVALGVLLLPVFATCYVGRECERASYIQQGGTVIGYLFLGLFLVLGIAAVVGPRVFDARRICAIRWLMVVLSAMFAVIGGWSIGLLFLPGGLLMLLPALSCRRQANRAVSR